MEQTVRRSEEEWAMVKELAMLKTENTDPRHNLALERYLTMHTKEGECILYLW